MVALPLSGVVAEAESIESKLIHLRSGEAREWASFPEAADGAHAEFRWQGASSSDEQTLMLRQQDVKQAWRVRVNDTQVGTLVTDENDMRLYLPLAAGTLRDGENVLQIEAAQRGAASDDIRVGEVHLADRPLREMLGEAHVEVRVVDEASGAALPARITIVDKAGALQPTSANSNDDLAVRTGVIYTKTGEAKFSLPAGEYTIYAGRGFEYSIAHLDVKLVAGETAKATLKISRKVPTDGYVACDTHIHTLTYSGHGDATIAERMITLAGEGIELPIATDHNVHVNYEEQAKRFGVRKFFTPVVGNEYTTPVGHFNIFPVAPDARVPDAKLDAWPKLFDEIFATPGVKVAILNHARDLHSGTRPLGPKLWNAAIGERVDGSPIRFNAMEVVNSGATQTDPLQLARDWMTLLNRGHCLTPIGSSDSHDVSRYIVGQGRTYIRCDDADAGKVDIDAAIESLLAGRVVVSYGLFTALVVDDNFHPGDLAVGDHDEVEVQLRVLGPSWATADRVRLFANGQLLRDLPIDREARKDLPVGVKFDERIRLQRPSYDIHLVAIASGPDVAAPYWPMAKPYQPTSPEFTAQALGISGAVWIDGDGDARRTSARDYAQRLIANHDASNLTKDLANYDAAVAAQAAHAYRLAHRDTWLDDIASAAKDAAPPVAAGFRSYLEAWRASELAGAER